MKKIFFSILMLSLAASFTACSDNDPDQPKPDQPEKPEKPGEDPEPEPGPGPVTPVYHGMFVANNGSYYNNLPGSLTYIDFENNEVIEDAFSKANNGMTVGDTFNDGLVDGDYIYLAVTTSSIIHVIDRETFVLVKEIPTNSDAGPRHLCAYNGKVYATLFGQPGYVIEIDPSTLEITNTVEVGPLPEYIVSFNDEIYVAVSDAYGTGSGSNVTVIDPATFTISREITGLINAVELATNGEQLFVSSWGTYNENWQQINYGIFQVENYELKDIDCPGIYMAIDGSRLYYLDAAYDEPVGYKVYDIATSTSSTWIEGDAVELPNGISVDPKTGNVFILSYELNDWGYGAYDLPGYVKEFTAEGTEVTTYQVGIGPSSIFFNISE